MAMQKRSIAWLKEQQISKMFYVCKDSDRKLIDDPDFEDWVLSESQKRPSTWWGDGFKTTDHSFSFCNQSPPFEINPDNPFPFIKPIYARYSCSWEHVTEIYEGEQSHWVYIFVK